ncbi:hypothetical protein D3C80_584810 [compost metagenome]
MFSRYGRHRAGGMVGTGNRRQGCAVTTVAAEHILQHLFTPLVLEVDVNVRRLIALTGEETLEQQVAVHRVQFSDAQHITHHRVGRRTPPLAENSLTTGKVDDVVNSEEIAFVVQLGNQLEFVLQGLACRVFEPPRPTPALPLFA